jgi:anti-sigma factor RsiW
MIGERDVGGVTCSQVLAGLSDYLDDELPAAARAQVEAHLRGCERCLRFGGALGAMVRALRADAAPPPDEPPALTAAELAARLTED